jgi:hypothetical protein
METSHPPAWLPDPMGRYQHRYWDGAHWTDQVSTNGTLETDPHGLAPSPASTTPDRPAGWALARPDWSNPIRLAILGGAALLILGSFLPWVEADAGFFSITKDGTDGDGVITLVIGLAIAALFFAVKHPKAMTWLVISLAGVGTAIAAYDTIDISNKAEELTNSTSTIDISAAVGVGLWLTLAGGIVALIGGFMALSRGPDNAPA